MGGTSRFPHTAFLTFDGEAYGVEEVRAALAPFVSQERMARIANVVAARTYNVVPVLEGVHDPGNLHAVMRSAEGLGCGATFVVRPEGDATILLAPYLAGEEVGKDELGRRAAARAAQGAHKWLDLAVWPSSAEFAAFASTRGYAIVTTHLSAAAVPIAEWDFTVPTALVFGNEKDGISEDLLAHADANVVLPIDGFVQSYNVSVAVALALHHARQDRLARQGSHGDLTEEEQAILTAHYFARSVAASGEIMRRVARRGQ